MTVLRYALFTAIGLFAVPLFLDQVCKSIIVVEMKGGGDMWSDIPLGVSREVSQAIIKQDVERLVRKAKAWEQWRGRVQMVGAVLGGILGFACASSFTRGRGGVAAPPSASAGVAGGRSIVSGQRFVQVVGKDCVSCSARIVDDTTARPCSRCSRPLHLGCSADPARHVCAACAGGSAD